MNELQVLFYILIQGFIFSYFARTYINGLISLLIEEVITQNVLLSSSVKKEGTSEELKWTTLTSMLTGKHLHWPKTRSRHLMQPQAALKYSTYCHHRPNEDTEVAKNKISSSKRIFLSSEQCQLQKQHRKKKLKSEDIFITLLLPYLSLSLSFVLFPSFFPSIVSEWSSRFSSPQNSWPRTNSRSSFPFDETKRKKKKKTHVS